MALNKQMLQTELYILEHRKEFIEVLIKDIKWQIKEIEKEEDK